MSHNDHERPQTSSTCQATSEQLLSTYDRYGEHAMLAHLYSIPHSATRAGTITFAPDRDGPASYIAHRPDTGTYVFGQSDAEPTACRPAAIPAPFITAHAVQRSLDLLDAGITNAMVIHSLAAMLSGDSEVFDAQQPPLPAEYITATCPFVLNAVTPVTEPESQRAFRDFNSAVMPHLYAAAAQLALYARLAMTDEQEFQLREAITSAWPFAIEINSIKHRPTPRKPSSTPSPRCPHPETGA